MFTTTHAVLSRVGLVLGNQHPTTGGANKFFPDRDNGFFLCRLGCCGSLRLGFKLLLAFALALLFPLFAAEAQEVSPSLAGENTAAITQQKSDQQTEQGQGTVEQNVKSVEKVKGHEATPFEVMIAQVFWVLTLALGFLIGFGAGSFLSSRFTRND